MAGKLTKNYSNVSFLHDEYRDIEIAYGMAERQLKEAKTEDKRQKAEKDLAGLSEALNDNREARGFRSFKKTS